MTPQAQTRSFHIVPIGHVIRRDGAVTLRILEPFRPALKDLDQFSHVNVIWWANRVDDPDCRAMLQVEPPYAPGHVTGIFATRSPVRPNPIATTTCKLIGVDEAQGEVRIASIDALDGTQILDLKAYFPVCDRVQDAHIPAWLVGWPEWMPEEGLALEQDEQ